MIILNFGTNTFVSLPETIMVKMHTSLVLANQYKNKGLRIKFDIQNLYAYVAKSLEVQDLHYQTDGCSPTPRLKRQKCSEIALYH